MSFFLLLPEPPNAGLCTSCPPGSVLCPQHFLPPHLQPWQAELEPKACRKQIAKSLQLIQDNRDILALCFTGSPWGSKNGGVLQSGSARAISRAQLQQIQYGARSAITNRRIRNSRKTAAVIFNGLVHNTKPFQQNFITISKLSARGLFKMGKQ